MANSVQARKRARQAEKHRQHNASQKSAMRTKIKGVIAAEEGACAQYHRIIAATQDHDPVTADLCTRLLADEEEHLVLFRGFLKEYESDFHGQKDAHAPVETSMNDTDLFIRA